MKAAQQSYCYMQFPISLFCTQQSTNCPLSFPGYYFLRFLTYGVPAFINIKNVLIRHNLNIITEHDTFYDIIKPVNLFPVETIEFVIDRRCPAVENDF